jgi:hypothetical protein
MLIVNIEVVLFAALLFEVHAKSWQNYWPIL